MKLLCKLGIHKWGPWHYHSDMFIWTYPFWSGPGRPDGAERHCERCGFTEITATKSDEKQFEYRQSSCGNKEATPAEMEAK